MNQSLHNPSSDVFRMEICDFRIWSNETQRIEKMFFELKLFTKLWPLSKIVEDDITPVFGGLGSRCPIPIQMFLYVCLFVGEG